MGGAAIGSVITTVGSSLYQRSLERARDRVRPQIPLPNAAFRDTLTISANETTLTTGADGWQPTVAEPGR